MKKSLIVTVLLFFLIAGLLTGCGGNPATDNGEGENAAGAAGGIFTGEAEGYGGKLKVKVTIDEGGKISLVEVDENHDETEGVADVPLEKIPEQIVSSQSLEVEAVSGATVTSKAIVSAVANALQSAGFDPATYGFAADTEEEVVFELDLGALPQKAEKTGSVTITDVKGRKIDLDLPVSTYGISTMDVIDFIIPVLGEEAFHKLVASGQDGGHGLQGYAKLYTSVVGSYMNHVGQISDHNAPFDLEMILATSPDVLIVNSAMGAHKYAMEVESQLEAAGIPIILIDVPGESFTTSTQDTLKLLGQIFEEEERAAEVASFIDDQFKLIASKNLGKKEHQPTVYYEKSGYAEIFGSTSSSLSGWGTVIETAGGDNIADPVLLASSAGKGGGNTLDPEYIIEADPDFIILSGSGAGWMDNFAGSTPSLPKFDIVKRTGWSNLKAVKEDQVYEIAHASSRSIFGFYAALKLAEVFYPEEFGSVDADAVMDDFFKRFMLVDSTVTGWFYRISEVPH